MQNLCWVYSPWLPFHFPWFNNIWFLLSFLKNRLARIGEHTSERSDFDSFGCSSHARYLKFRTLVSSCDHMILSPPPPVYLKDNSFADTAVFWLFHYLCVVLINFLLQGTKFDISFGWSKHVLCEDSAGELTLKIRIQVALLHLFIHYLPTYESWMLNWAWNSLLGRLLHYNPCNILGRLGWGVSTLMLQIFARFRQNQANIAGYISQ